jgi:hypothetical protein
MTNSFQISSKLNDGRIFVVGGDNFEEFNTNLESLLGMEQATNLIAVMEASLLNRNSTAEAVTVINNTLNTPTQSTPNIAPVGKTCKHGEMAKRTGTGAKGQWKAFMCPAPKGAPDQCDPIWVRKNEPEWATF